MTFKKLSEVSPVLIPLESTQPLLDEEALPPKPGICAAAEEVQFVGISCNVRAGIEGHHWKVHSNLCASVKWGSIPTQLAEGLLSGDIRVLVEAIREFKKLLFLPLSFALFK